MPAWLLGWLENAIFGWIVGKAADKIKDKLVKPEHQAEPAKEGTKEDVKLAS